jgi:hypothetical protein
MRTVYEHDGAQSQAHDEQGKRLQAIEIAQGDSLRTDGIEYRSGPLGKKQILQKTIAPPDGF